MEMLWPGSQPPKGVDWRFLVVSFVGRGLVPTLWSEDSRSTENKTEGRVGEITGG